METNNARSPAFLSDDQVTAGSEFVSDTIVLTLFPQLIIFKISSLCLPSSTWLLREMDRFFTSECHKPFAPRTEQSNIRLRSIYKCSILWDITPCSPLKVIRRFGRTYFLHFEFREISRELNQRENMWQANYACQLQLVPRSGIRGS
jgi:hypothetical protein